MRKTSFRSRRAVSGTLAGVFVVIVILLASNAAIWLHSQQSNIYAEIRNVEDARQQGRLESFHVLKIIVSSSRPNATIQNTGIVTIRIVDLIVTSLSDTPVWHNLFSVSHFISPGSQATNIGQSLPPIFDPQKVYSIAFVTERGKRVTGTYDPNQLTMGSYATFGNVGYLSIKFEQNAFRYTSEEQESPIQAWTLAKNKVCGEDPLWWVTFVNHGTYDAYILKWSVAQLWLLKSAGGGGTPQDFYIVGYDSRPSHLESYVDNSIIVPKSASGDWQTGGTPTTLKFGATTAGGTGDQNLSGCEIGAIYDFFIVVSYMYNGQQFNQLIPYAATVVNSYW